MSLSTSTEAGAPMLGASLPSEVSGYRDVATAPRDVFSRPVRRLSLGPPQEATPTDCAR